MKTNLFQLSIPSPCQEDWNQMTPQGENRHCQKCSTLIIDFTKMSDKEITDFFENNHGKVCGRINKKQTQKIYYDYSEEKRISFHLPRIAVSWLLVSWLSLSPAVNAQELKPAITEQVAKNTTKNQTQDSIILKGTIVDAQDMEPLMSVEIYLDTNLISHTDLDGNFVLNLPENLPKKSKIIIKYPWYESQKIPIRTIDFSKPLNIQLKEDLIIVGKVIIKTNDNH